MIAIDERAERIGAARFRLARMNSSSFGVAAFWISAAIAATAPMNGERAAERSRAAAGAEHRARDPEAQDAERHRGERAERARRASTESVVHAGAAPTAKTAAPP